ncbi:DUF7483 domain-containing protein [Marinomonas atlantica]|uniref:DUF7483 domain-containing protein n=1 Tax=Marinomonas atlantica TaxID=1806668 RepID=UPI00082FC032|nr:phage tail protein [Marinomonas atlantica]
MAVNGTITTAGAAYLSQRISAMANVTIDHFVMANVPGIDETTEADPNFVLAEEYIVATAPVYRLAHNGENSVVYSMVLDGEEGDYDFNWYGLVTNTGVVLAFANIPQVAKRASVGQVINRNFILPFTAAKALTGADIPSESWQFDFTETIAEVTVSLLGPRYVYTGGTYTYQFTDWDDFSTYSVFSDVGVVTLGNAEMTLDIPSNTTAEECLVTVIRNGSARVLTIRVGDPVVAQPTLIAPVDGAPNIAETPTLTMSPFKTFPPDTDTQLSADWELYDANDNLVLSSYDDTVSLSAFTIPEGVLTEGGYGYKWRGRQNGQVLGNSEWSELSIFTTKDQFAYNSAPTLIAPLSGSTDIALQPMLTISGYSVTPAGFDAVDAVQFQLYSDSGLENLVWDSGVLTSGFTSVQVGVELAIGQEYYWVARHRGSSIGWTGFSVPWSFVTREAELPQGVFSADLYFGNLSGVQINNGIDFAGKDGMLWIKQRDNPNAHALYDTIRGPLYRLRTPGASAHAGVVGGLESFNADGFTLGGNVGETNQNGVKHVAWSFRKAVGFFDVFEFEGDGATDRALSHGLGKEVGAYIVKRIDGASDFWLWHRAVSKKDSGGYRGLKLNDAAGLSTYYLGDSDPTNTELFVSGDSNVLGARYIVYVFAHDPSPSGIIQCGGGGAYQRQDLGWRPQFIFQAGTNGSNGDRQLIDDARGIGPSGEAILMANQTGYETTDQDAILEVDGTGFKPNAGGPTIFIAIREPIPV